MSLAETFGIVERLIPDRRGCIFNVPDPPRIARDAVENREPEVERSIQASPHKLRQIAMSEEGGEFARIPGAVLAIDGSDA
jgi:hypothetical protein